MCKDSYATWLDPTEDNLIPLRPIPEDGIQPYRLKELIGKKITKDLQVGGYIRCTYIE